MWEASQQALCSIVCLQLCAAKRVTASWQGLGKPGTHCLLPRNYDQTKVSVTKDKGEKWETVSLMFYKNVTIILFQSVVNSILFKVL